MDKIIALVADEELRTGKKSPFWQMGLRTTHNNFKAIIWDIADPQKAGVPRKGDLIQIDLKADGVKDQRESKYNNLILTKNAIVKLDKEKVGEDVINKIFDSHKATQQQLEQAYKIITDKSLYKDADHFAFVMACLASLPKDKLFSCPAGSQVHHAFNGGLIIHTSEVLSICKGIILGLPHHNFIDQDVVFAGATLHDMGKVTTYDIDEIGQPFSAIEERTVGHLYYGMSLAEKVGKERNIDKDWLNEVIHVVASHHGQPEYGAVVPPMTLEATIVAQADYIGSRFGILEQQLNNVKKGDNIPDRIKAYRDYYVLGNAIKGWLKK